MEDVEEFLEIKEKNGNFRIQNQRLLLTYKTHIDKNEVKAWMKKKFNAEEIHICHESGDKTNPYLHSHVFVIFNKCFQSRNSRIFDWNGIHPNIKKVNSATHINNCYKYLAKEDPDCKYCLDLIKKGFNISDILKAPSPIDAMAGAKNANDAYAISRLHETYSKVDNKDSWDDSADDDIELWNWQKEILSMVTVKPKRHEMTIINWIFDEQGQNGKSTLCKTLERNDSKHIAYIEGLGSAKDIVETIYSKRKNGWTGRVLLINLSRGSEQFEFYNVLENLSDGSMTRLKYNGGDIRYKAYHVIVFANWAPKIERITFKRWKINKLSGSGNNAVLIPINSQDLLTQQHLDTQPQYSYTTFSNNPDSPIPSNIGGVRFRPHVTK